MHFRTPFACNKPKAQAKGIERYVYFERPSLATSLKRKRRALNDMYFERPSLALQACEPGREVRRSDPSL